jgi:glycosyltransferase involved in cell wall biosynthesis
MSEKQPLISVTLPNYNYGRFLAQAFESILMQSYQNFELLFTDDGSTDDSVAIAHQFAARDSRIKPVYFDRNCGALVAHANTWSRVNGSIVYQFSSDDFVADPDFFRLGVEALNKHPNASGFYGVAAIVSAEENLLKGLMGRASLEGYVGPQKFLQEFLTDFTFVPGISSLWRKKLIDAVGGYDVRLGPQADYFINHALPCLSGVVFAKRHFATARVSEGRVNFSKKMNIYDEMKHWSLVEKKLRNVTTSFGNLDAEWECWRKYQLSIIYSNWNQSS